VLIGYLTGRQQAIDRLESVAVLKETRMTVWLQSMVDDLQAALNEEYALERASIVLSLANVDKYSSYYQKAVRNRFLRFLEQTEFEELLLVDHGGRVVLSTQTDQEGQNLAGEAFFRQGLERPFIQLPFSAPLAGAGTVMAAVPVISEQGQVLGVLAGRANSDSLREILREQTGLGLSGRAFLVNADQALLTSEGTEALPAPPVQTQGIAAVLRTQASGAGTYSNQAGREVVGVYRWVPAYAVGLLVEQDQAEALQTVSTTLGTNLGIVAASLVIAIFVAWLIARSISRPLVELVATAKRIAAGDLHRLAAVGPADEVGELAQAFNSMTAQLRDLIGDLEQRVHSRTQALRQRAVQLETSAKVSREITSILDINDLLRRVVELIRDAFGYYHVNVYLADRETQRLVLRASTGPVGVTDLAIEDRSLNSTAVVDDAPVVINDVAADARYLEDRNLPATRSELVVPMHVGGNVIGTLDVHSTQLNAFKPEDALVIQSLGDQIAIAIANAHLYEQSRHVAVLEERHRLARELHDSVSQALFSIELHAKAIATYARRDPQQTETHLQQLRQIAHDARQEMRSLIFDLRPSTLDDGGLVAALRGQVDRLRALGGLQVELEISGDRRLPAAAERDLYRIFQEALHNVVKHASARRVDVSLDFGPQQARLRVADDGKGFDPQALAANGRGFGLLGMRERAEALGGCLEIASQPGHGTEVVVKIPA
jgi:nitrate/nitrite-specific signal transduction histidine kinase